ncbi:hypothetical protein FOL47_006717 [Perkinsus chesapeaki]|uniref:Uncharacterized protein n=1 Tax=Perkinsus chesapeaki TaxID=330153 RepID=A0A7J6MWW2_PERCH|nr:hypothetical protein FOL47_006717 [Perkinsus chesapeaki]
MALTIILAFIGGLWCSEGLEEPSGPYNAMIDSNICIQTIWRDDNGELKVKETVKCYKEVYESPELDTIQVPPTIGIDPSSYEAFLQFMDKAKKQCGFEAEQSFMSNFQYIDSEDSLTTARSEGNVVKLRPGSCWELWHKFHFIMHRSHLDGLDVTHQKSPSCKG